MLEIEAAAKKAKEEALSRKCSIFHKAGAIAYHQLTPSQSLVFIQCLCRQMHNNDGGQHDWCSKDEFGTFLRPLRDSDVIQ